MKRVLITRGSGFLGRELALKLKNNYEVILGSRNNVLNQEADHHSEEEMIDLITNDEEKLKSEILEWLMAFSHMAYTPMSDKEFSDYSNFSKSELGIALNKALFSVYNEMAKDQSQRLASILGEFMKSEDL